MGEHRLRDRVVEGASELPELEGLACQQGRRLVLDPGAPQLDEAGNLEDVVALVDARVLACVEVLDEEDTRAERAAADVEEVVVRLEAACHEVVELELAEVFPVPEPGPDRAPVPVGSEVVPVAEWDALEHPLLDPGRDEWLDALDDPWQTPSHCYLLCRWSGPRRRAPAAGGIPRLPWRPICTSAGLGSSRAKTPSVGRGAADAPAQPTGQDQEKRMNPTTRIRRPSVISSTSRRLQVPRSKRRRASAGRSAWWQTRPHGCSVTVRRGRCRLRGCTLSPDRRGPGQLAGETPPAAGNWYLPAWTARALLVREHPGPQRSVGLAPRAAFRPSRKARQGQCVAVQRRSASNAPTRYCASVGASPVKPPPAQFCRACVTVAVSAPATQAGSRRPKAARVVCAVKPVMS